MRARVQLKTGEFINAIREGKKFILVKVVQEKTDEPARPCFGYESLESIAIWLRYRNSQRISNESDSPLFLMSNRAEQIFNKGLNPQNVSSIIKRLKDNAGFSGDNLGAHSFRKFNQTQLEASGIAKNWIYSYQGRDIPDSGESYSEPSDEQLLEAYERSYPYLSLENGNGQTKLKVSELKQKLEEKDKEIAFIMARMKAYESAVDQFPIRIEDRELSQEMVKVRGGFAKVEISEVDKKPEDQRVEERARELFEKFLKTQGIKK